MFMKELTIKQAQNEVREFLDTQGKGWTQIDNRFYLFTHMVEEIGELARHIITLEFNLSLDRVSKKSTSKEEMLSRLEDDLGDILYHLFKIAVAYDIDLTGGFRKAMSDIKRRYAAR